METDFENKTPEVVSYIKEHAPSIDNAALEDICLHKIDGYT